jgi:hypothetical protein
MSPGPTNLLGCNNNISNNSGPDPLNSVRQHLTKTLRTPPSYYYYHQQNSLGPLNDPLPLSTNSISMPSLISNNTNAMRPPAFPPTRNQSFQPHLPAARKLSKLSNLCWVSSVSQPDLTLTTTTLSPVNSLPTSRASSPGAPLSRCTSPHPPPPLAGGGSPYGSAYLVGRAGGGGGGGSLGGSQVGLSSLTNTTSSSSYYLNQLASQPLVRHNQHQQSVPVYTSRFEQRQSAAAALLFPSSSSPPPNHMFQPDPGPLLPMSYHQQLHSHRSPEPQPAPFFSGGGGWRGSGGLLYSPPLPELLSPSYEQQQQQFNAWNCSGGGGGSMSPPPYPTEVLLSDINGNQQEWQQQEHKQHWQQEHKQHWQQEHKQHWQPMVSACCSGVGGPPHRIDLNQNHVGGGSGEQRYLQQQQQQQLQQQQLRASPSRSLAAPSFPGGGGVEQGKPCAIIMPQQQQQPLVGREEGGGCRCSLSSSSPPSPLFGLPYAASDMEQLYKQQQQRAVSVPRQTTAATSPQPRWLPRLQRSVGTSCSDLLAWEQQQQQEQFTASNNTAVVAATIPFVVEMCQICNVFLKGSGDGQCARPYYRYSPCQYGGQVVVAEGGGQPPQRGPPAQLILKRWAQRPNNNQVLCYK